MEAPEKPASVCVHCGSAAVLQRVNVASGVRFFYNCPYHPSPIGGVKLTFTIQEAKMNWNERNGDTCE